MAGNMVYSIQLQLRVDDSQLDATIAKLGTLKKAAKEINEKATAGYSKKKKLTDEEIIARSARKWKQRNLEERLNIGARWRLRQFGQWRFSQAGWQNGLGVFQKRVKTFQDSFFNNVSSFSGLRYNMVNLGKVFTSLTGVVGKSIPAIGKFAQVAIGAAKILIGMHAWRLVSSGIPFLVGTKLLNSNNMAEAASNLMQMRMAEKGLGGNYQATLNRATQLAAEYGFSRVGMLNAMNMFTGLNVDGKKLTPEEASHLAEVVGKIAHVGGLSFDRVNANLQQLFGQAVPSIRDIRELVGQAPFIGKLAMNMMEERGVQGDYRDWLKNKSNLRSVLDEFNELVESHPVMKARGQIALAKENFWMRIADGLSPYWDKIAQANEKLYSWLSDKIVNWISNIDVNKVGAKLDQFILELDTFASAIQTIANTIGSIANGISFGQKQYGEFDPETGGVRMTWGLITNKDAALFTTMANNIAKKKAYGREVSRIAEFAAKRAREAGHGDIVQAAYDKLNSNEFIDAFVGTSSYFNWRDTDDTKKIRKPTLSKLGIKAISDLFSAGLRGITGTGGRSTDPNAQTVSNLSQGSKSVFINFNKEIVDMDINIASVENIDELGRKLEPKIEEVVVRGLTIALNNATSVT
jgi:hypothetical protein